MKNKMLSYTPEEIMTVVFTCSSCKVLDKIPADIFFQMFYWKECFEKWMQEVLLMIGCRQCMSCETVSIKLITEYANVG